MKHLFYTVLCIGFATTLTNCSRKTTPIQKETGAIKINTPFNSKEYRSDADYFRAVQSGTSPDLPTAKKIAKQNSRASLAADISSLVQRVTDQYTNQRSVSNVQEFENKFEELSREAVMLAISNVREIGEENFKESNGSYTCWMAIEASKKDVFEKIDSKISNDAKLKLDYDKQKFEKIFNEEMDKLRND